MREVPCDASGYSDRTVMTVATVADLAREWNPSLSWLVNTPNLVALAETDSLRSRGLGNLSILTDIDGFPPPSNAQAVRAPRDALCPGDVVAVVPGRSKLQVLYRESDEHHTVFLTNRCNSSCLMCSQPPTRHDDSWLIDEALSVCRHIRHSPKTIGFTGGEPLLLGHRLREVLDAFAQRHTDTEFDLLTNGRRLSDQPLAEYVARGLKRVTWMVPLYGHADYLHDFVVQSHGAFDETIDGLLTLHSLQQPVQLRIVLIEPVLANLPELCSFIAMNLPFVREVALMGCEPIGFALANRSLCQVDIAPWATVLDDAVAELETTSIRPVLMNLPLCALPARIRKHAHKSISDWKQVYADECSGCAVRSECSGLFSWHERGWRPTTLKPIRCEVQCEAL